MPVALVNFDGIVHVIDQERVIGNVVDSTSSATSLEIAAQFCGSIRPNFDTSPILSYVSNQGRGKGAEQTYAGVVHRGLVNIDVLNDIVLAWILYERSNRYTM